MGLFDRIKTTVGSTANSLAKGTGTLAAKGAVEAKEQAKIVAVKADIAAIQSEIDLGYSAIGKLYVEKLLAGAEITDFGAGETLKILEPKLEKKMSLEKELIELEKALDNAMLMQEKAALEAEYEEQKAKLDKAKGMGVISDADYEAKLAQARKKVDHFQDIRMLKKQKELGIITENEMNAKIKELLG
ncbi:MAG: hypothetical protein IKS20_04925 [Victivallales bacterium]|nr:hypothetical protein [Victivallales bacterium]